MISASQVGSAFRNTKRITFVLGAGASKGAGYPVVQDLLSEDYIDFVFAAMPSINKGEKIEVYINEIKDKIRYIKTLGNNFEKVFTSAVESNNTALVSFLKGHLSHIFYNCRDLTVNFHEYMIPHYTFGHVLCKLYIQGMCSDVITFNYDVVLDCAIKEFGLKFNLLNYGFLETVHYPNNRIMTGILPVQPPYNGPINILKVHGSLNWGFCDNCNTTNIFHTESLYFDKEEEEDMYNLVERNQCWKCQIDLSEPHILPPTTDKEKTLFPSQWKLSEVALNESDTVVFIGYSMPPYDINSINLFTNTCSKPGNKSKKFVVVDKYFDSEKKERFTNIVDDCTFFEMSFTEFVNIINGLTTY